MSDPIIEASETGWIAKHRELYLKDGSAGHMWDSTVGGGPGPLPTLLLFTTGKKSGKESIMPLLYGKVDGGYAIIASKGGDTTRVLAGAEREKVWSQMADMYPPFTAYQKAAGARQIPVVVLEPKA
jgi:hypothetical protein